jgi:hypothetical protein
MVIRVSFGTLGTPLRLGVGSMGWVVMSDVRQALCIVTRHTVEE